MKPESKAMFEEAGLKVEPYQLWVALASDEAGGVMGLAEGQTEVPVTDGEKVALLPLPPLSGLLTGTGKPPDFSREPPEEYVPVFLCIERTGAVFCSQSERPVPDQEFERLYDLLRRRPDGKDKNPAFAYLQAAARLAATIKELSPAEFEAVTRRLAKSAKRFGTHVGSTNYYERALRDFT